MASTESTAKWNAGLYQSAHAFVWQKAADLIELLDPKAGERVLDLGCGTGQLTAAIAKHGVEVIGIDRSAEMIAQARSNFPELRFEIGDATSFTLDRRVDAVFSNATLHWVKPPEDAVKRIWTSLKPNGRLIAEFGGRGNVARISAALRHALWRIAGFEFDRISPWYYPSVGEYAGLLERHGFAVTFARLFERPTPLEGAEAGLGNWLKMFGASLLEHVPANQRDAVRAAAEDHARPDLYHDGRWTADYVRLRVSATRPA